MSDVSGREFGELVASRTVEAVDVSGNVVELTLELGKPRPALDKDWICPCRIRGFDDSRVWLMYGIDGLQAITIATDLLAGQLAAAAEERGWKFNWLDAENLEIDEVLHKRPGYWDRREGKGAF